MQPQPDTCTSASRVSYQKTTDRKRVGRKQRREPQIYDPEFRRRRCRYLAYGMQYNTKIHLPLAEAAVKAHAPVFTAGAQFIYLFINGRCLIFAEINGIYRIRKEAEEVRVPKEKRCGARRAGGAAGGGGGRLYCLIGFPVLRGLRD
ncbi:hypothetical protein EVAR_9081_1 [Eumeta japonica]|uniref:Uncharacterized protein n=1 Tax=Eumeta variegata TaxID=151549 RepID=A0A4C1TW45_EUMVA|nr:hypothetical protein EVAR_9081_1 [Eumeta japonica]